MGLVPACSPWVNMGIKFLKLFRSPILYKVSWKSFISEQSVEEIWKKGSKRLTFKSGKILIENRSFYHGSNYHSVFSIFEFYIFSLFQRLLTDENGTIFAVFSSDTFDDFFIELIKHFCLIMACSKYFQRKQYFGI